VECVELFALLAAELATPAGRGTLVSLGLFRRGANLSAADHSPVALARGLGSEMDALVGTTRDGHQCRGFQRS
jgi:hypothetical protein